MTAYKQIWYWEGGGSTWTDVYYRAGTQLESAANLPLAFINKRLRLLDEFFTLKKIRTSDTTLSRSSIITPYNLAGQWSDWQESDDPPATTSEAVVLTLVSTANPCSRRVWIRGIGEDAATRSKESGRDVLSPIFSEAIKEWIKALASNGYIIYAKVKQNPANTRRITEVDGTGGVGQSIIKTDQAIPGLNLPLTIEISQTSAKDLPGLNGTFQVQGISQGLYPIINYVTPQNALYKLANGIVKKKAYTDNAVIDPTKSNFNFVGSRQTKNINTGSRGARPAKRIRTQS